MKLKEEKSTILCGDLNVAHQGIDIYDPKNHDKVACFNPQERAGFGELLKSGFVDTFRELYPGEKKFSFYSARFDSRGTNRGWRLDYFLVDSVSKRKVKDSTINTGADGSDHHPVELIYTL
jgi:exodeoxyribonuclease III